jgi:hypothetical protein
MKRKLVPTVGRETIRLLLLRHHLPGKTRTHGLRRGPG